MFRYVRSRAERKRDILDKIDNHANELLIHLCKVYQFRDTQYKHHWVAEVWGQCNSVNKCRGNHKFPKSEDIYNAIWEYRDNHFSDYFENARYEEYDIVSEYTDVESAYMFCVEYTKYISFILNEKGIVSFNEATSKIEKLLQKYNS